MTARSHVAAPEGYELLVMRDDGGVNSMPILAFYLVDEYIDGLITPTGEQLITFDNLDSNRAMRIPGGRVVTSDRRTFASQAAWVAACRRRQMVGAR